MRTLRQGQASRFEGEGTLPKERRGACPVGPGPWEKIPRTATPNVESCPLVWSP